MIAQKYISWSRYQWKHNQNAISREWVIAHTISSIDILILISKVSTRNTIIKQNGKIVDVANSGCPFISDDEMMKVSLNCHWDRILIHVLPERHINLREKFHRKIFTERPRFRALAEIEWGRRFVLAYSKKAISRFFSRRNSSKKKFN